MSEAVSATALDPESTGNLAEIGGMRLHYHDAGSAPAETGSGPGDAGTVVLLHGGGPGASAWSNFGKNMPAFAARFLPNSAVE